MTGTTFSVDRYAPQRNPIRLTDTSTLPVCPCDTYLSQTATVGAPFDGPPLCPVGDCKGHEPHMSSHVRVLGLLSVHAVSEKPLALRRHRTSPGATTYVTKVRLGSSFSLTSPPFQ